VATRIQGFAFMIYYPYFLQGI